MLKVLSKEQVEAYRSNGCIFPIRIMSGDEARRFRDRFEALEREIGGEAQSRFKIKAHLPFPWMHDLIRNEIMLDAVEDLIGPDILCWGSSFFTKQARDPRFVSWHQDSTYYGLRPAETVTPWFAFSRSSVEAGCMRFVPGTHKMGLIEHAETADKHNLLVRGQTIAGVDEDEAVDVELEPGQISIHHESVVHGSGANRSADARIGLSIHYIAPHVRQTAFENATALVVRGKDTHGYWKPDPEPRKDFDPDCLAALDRAYAHYKSGVGKLREGGH
jgi:ectoine hydroxylase-related dioxygenase (phytanoyl-CoA dioxygenase family)